MGTNHWLKEYRDARRLISESKVCLYYINSSTMEFYEYQKISLNPTWDFALANQSSIPMTVDGIAINHLKNGNLVKTLWHKKFTNVVNTHPSDSVTVTLSLKIGKWPLGKLL